MEVSSRSPDPLSDASASGGGKMSSFSKFHTKSSSSNSLALQCSRTYNSSDGRVVRSAQADHEPGGINTTMQSPVYSLSPLSGNQNGLGGLDEVELSFFLNSGTPDGLNHTNISPGLSYFSGSSPLSHPHSFAPSGLEFTQVLPPTQEEVGPDASSFSKPKMRSINYPATPATQYYSSKIKAEPPTQTYNQGKNHSSMQSGSQHFSSSNAKGSIPASTSTSSAPPVPVPGQMIPAEHGYLQKEASDNMDNLSLSFMALGHSKPMFGAPAMQPIAEGKSYDSHSQPDKEHLNWIRHLNTLAGQNRQFDNMHPVKSALPQPQYGRTVGEKSVMPHFRQFSQAISKGNGVKLSVSMAPTEGPTQYIISRPELMAIRPSSSASSCDNQRIRSFQENDSYAESEVSVAENSKKNGSDPQTPSAVENDERRARRLARNRESARQSRRRKKENLKYLGDQVNKLYNLIELERGNQIRSMEEAFSRAETSRVQKLLNFGNSEVLPSQCSNELQHREEVKTMIDAFTSDMMLRREVTGFHVSTIRRHLLPYYQQFLLWISCQDEKFFVAGKESKGKSSSRMTSKQIGEEITASEKTSNATITSKVDDLQRFWPLLSFEMQFSADQEDRFKVIHAGIKQRQKEVLLKDKARVSSALNSVSTLKKLLQSYHEAAVYRRERVFVSTLTPKQSILYMKWASENRERLKCFCRTRPVGKTDELSRSQLFAQLEDSFKIQSEKNGAIAEEQVKPPGIE